MTRACADCADCRYYHARQASHTGHAGTCQRRALVRLPRKFVSTNDRTRDETISWGWPEVFHNDWCGEWRSPRSWIAIITSRLR